jgi:hypothetical protein
MLPVTHAETTVEKKAAQHVAPCYRRSRSPGLDLDQIGHGPIHPPKMMAASARATSSSSSSARVHQASAAKTALPCIPIQCPLRPVMHRHGSLSIPSSFDGKGTANATGIGISSGLTGRGRGLLVLGREGASATSRDGSGWRGESGCGWCPIIR